MVEFMEPVEIWAREDRRVIKAEKEPSAKLVIPALWDSKDQLV